MHIGGKLSIALLVTIAAVMAVDTSATAQQRPNIVMIMGDDVGWSNIGVYNQGIMAGRTPNLDKLASQGVRFTDYYAERAVLPDAPTSLLASFRSELGSRRWGRPARPPGCRIRRRR